MGASSSEAKERVSSMVAWLVSFVPVRRAGRARAAGLKCPHYPILASAGAHAAQPLAGGRHHAAWPFTPRQSSPSGRHSTQRDLCDDSEGYRPDLLGSSPRQQFEKTTVVVHRPISLDGQQHGFDDTEITMGLPRTQKSEPLNTPQGHNFHDHYYDSGNLLLGESYSGSRVYLVESKRYTGAKLASKTIPFTQSDTSWLTPSNNYSAAEMYTRGKAQAQAQVDFLQRCNHPNIIQVVDVFWEPDCCRLVTPYLRGGDLMTSLACRGSLIERDARSVMTGLFSALRHLHCHGIAHRDVKLENIGLEASDDFHGVKLFGFGLAREVPASGCLLKPAGTPAYTAPEVVTWANSNRSHSRYGVQADLWSCGVLMYTLLRGSHPFGGETVAQLFKNIRSGAYSFQDPAWLDVSSEAKHLIVKLLDSNWQSRITASQALRHPWIVKMF